MDRIDKRVWYAVAAVVVLLVFAWLLGWFGGAETPRRHRQGEASPRRHNAPGAIIGYGPIDRGDTSRGARHRD